MFCTLPCHYVRIGNYEVVPRGSVLVTREHIQLTVPMVPASRQAAPQHVTVDLALEEVVNIVAHLGPDLSVLYIFLDELWCRKVRSLLGMHSRHFRFLEPCAGQHDSRRRITLLLKAVKPSELLCLKAQIRSKLHEIPTENAWNILKQSEPEKLDEEPSHYMNLEPLKLDVKKALTSSNLYLTWQESSDQCHVPRNSIWLEKFDSDSESWKPFEQRQCEGALVTARLSASSDTHSATYDLQSARRPDWSAFGPGPSTRQQPELHLFRVRLEDDKGREHLSNEVSITV